ncbi:MAG: DUF488 family protein [Atribacterota bacterium]
MLKESYLANLKNLPENAMKIHVYRPNLLSPSKELLWSYKLGKIDWKEYERRFRKQIIDNPKAMTQLGLISTASKKRDVYLICYEKYYPCHRFILIEMIKELNNITKKLKSQTI